MVLTTFPKFDPFTMDKETYHLVKEMRTKVAKSEEGRLYSQRPENKLRKRRKDKLYRDRPDIKKKQKQYNKLYTKLNSERIKLHKIKYARSEKGQQRRREYRASRGYKQGLIEYRKTDAYKACQRSETRRVYQQIRNQLESVKERKRKYKKSLKGKQRTREYEKHRRENEPEYKMKCILRRRLLSAVSRYKTKKWSSTTGLLGCTMNHFVNHIETMFQPGMTWENHGVYKRGGEMKWHLDHIIPVSSYDVTLEEQQKRCFHYSNFQPLWAVDNLKKGAKNPMADKRVPVKIQPGSGQ